METKEIYVSVWRGLLKGLFAIGIGLWIILSADGSEAGFFELYFLPFMAVVCLLVGFWVLGRPVVLHLTHHPYLRLTEEALEVLTGLGNNYEHYPWKQIDKVYEGMMGGRDYLVIHMKEGFVPRYVNPSSHKSRRRVKRLGSPYAFFSAVTPYSSFELLTWLNDYWHNAKSNEA
ncbi:MAG: hypothetical protein ACOYJK_03930 [Prevotella sp.]